MDINGAHVLVAGATGVIGGAFTAELAARAARPALAGRGPGRLARAAQEYPGAPIALFDAYVPETCARAVYSAAAVLGGLEVVVVAFGSVAFGRADMVGDEVAERLMAVNVLTSAAFLEPGVVTDRPQPGMADYNASKAALSVWLAAVCRDARPAGIRVLEVRPGHLDTGFASRAVAGTAPPLPPGGDLRQVVRAGFDALATDAETVRTAPDGTPVIEPRAR
ncbi:SDR family NAD(P)-dependent oxidoreductase [Streptomyces sp. NBC_01224]|uniref:SDR family NAD(P)-dependent oxidoreductase n=1 Tax=Streptomyces sp. NBC_01224 TaxID=2903783 RepID=UPI002E0D32A8|nr:SDR family NAD(P)-dependent oxidoreductase [Streptomyces sp. NBC_01224]